MITPVSSPNDPRIEGYLDIRERDLVGRRNRFIAEGEVVLRVLARSPYGVESLLISEKQAAFAEEMAKQLADDVPIYLASQRVMNEIVGFSIHRGLLAIGIRKKHLDTGELLSSLPADALVIGLIGLANHDNIGGIFRNAAAFGVDAIFMDSTCCDPLYRKSLRVSVGGVLKVPFARVPDADAMLDVFTQCGFETLALSPAGRENLTTASPSRKTALLFGSEGSGLPRHILSAVRTIIIPMAGGFDSLNVATTCGIALFRMKSAEPR